MQSKDDNLGVHLLHPDVMITMVSSSAIHYSSAPLYGMVSYIILIYTKAVIYIKLIAIIAIGINIFKSGHVEFQNMGVLFTFNGISKN